jgi:hypothetical protein
MRYTLILLSLLAFSFSAMAQNPAPIVYQPLVPLSTVPGGAQFTLTVNGFGFVSGAAVKWNGAALATTFVSSSQLTAVVPAADIATATTASIAVVNPGTNVASNLSLFSVGVQNNNLAFAASPTSPISFPGPPTTPPEPLSMVSADFNGDGKPDLAFGLVEGMTAGYTINVYFSNGDGTFTAGPVTPVAGMTPGTMIVADFNGDGKMDLAITDELANTVTILLGNGAGGFTLAPASPISTGMGTGAVATGDFNHDGKLDLAVANFTDKTISILLGNGDGSFTPATGSPVATGSHPGGLAVGDFNGDGKLDVAAANFTEGTVTILLGNGDGTFTPAAASPSAHGASLISAADFNGDGKLDLVVSDFSNSTFTILLGQGDGTFTPVSGCCGISAPQSFTLALLLGDFNNDGKLDIALSIQNENQLDYITTFNGIGDGTFASTNFSVQVPQQPESMVLGDFNGDGMLDLVPASNPDSNFTVLLQASAPNAVPDFTVMATPPAAPIPPGMAATFSVNVTSVNGFLGTVSLSCSGAPANSTCSVAAPASQLVSDQNSVGYQVTITTTAATTALSLPPDPAIPPQRRWPLALLAAMLGIFGVTTLLRIAQQSGPRRALAIIPFAAVLVCAALFSSCGSGMSNNGGNPPPTGGTPAGSYMLTITATSGNISHTTTAPFTVN